MSKFSSDYINKIEPYVPGEQPKDRKYVKLNTNENPFPPSDAVTGAIDADAVANLRRYSDPEAKKATEALAESLGVKEENVLLTNGSDEAIAFSFLAYGEKGLVFPDVTYSFYKNIAGLFRIPFETVPLDEKFRVKKEDYFGAGKTIVLANPNAQTGIALSTETIEDILKKNEDDVVIIDQAYAAFSPYDAVPLVSDYKNLVIIETFSKCRSLAGARLGYVVADKELIEDIKKVKFSFNPYNVNALSQILAINSVKDDGAVMERVADVVRLRDFLELNLKLLGFRVLPSNANFLSAEHEKLNGETLYKELKERGVLVRHFSDDRIRNFVRITVGTKEENEALLEAVKDILEETK